MNQRNYSMLSWIILPHHGVTLSGTCLSICEDADVVPVHGMLQHFNSYVFVNLCLTDKVFVVRLQMLELMLIIL